MFWLKNISANFFPIFQKIWTENQRPKYVAWIFEGLRVSFNYIQEMIMTTKMQIETLVGTKCSHLNSQKNHKIDIWFDKKQSFTYIILTHKLPVMPSYRRNESIDLHSKSIDWFLYEGNTGI